MLATDERVTLAVAGLIVWGHGAGWLVVGEVRGLPSVLADLAGPTWGVYLATWWLPMWVCWVVGVKVVEHAS